MTRSTHAQTTHKTQHDTKTPHSSPLPPAPKQYCPHTPPPWIPPSSCKHLPTTGRHQPASTIPNLYLQGRPWTPPFTTINPQQQQATAPPNTLPPPPSTAPLAAARAKAPATLALSNPAALDDASRLSTGTRRCWNCASQAPASPSGRPPSSGRQTFAKASDISSWKPSCTSPDMSDPRSPTPKANLFPLPRRPHPGAPH